MPTQVPNEREINIREFLGVDLTANARITNPGSWHRLQNLWMETPAELSQRPGSRRWATNYVLDQRVPTNDWIEDPTGFTGWGAPTTSDVLLQPWATDNSPWLNQPNPPTVPFNNPIATATMGGTAVPAVQDTAVYTVSF